MPTVPSPSFLLPEKFPGRSLAEHLCALQREYAIVNDKSLEWASNLRCLRVPAEAEAEEQEILILQRIPQRDFTRLRNYVAVSYSCEHMPDFEEKELGGYNIKQGPRDSSWRPNKTRNIAIQRAIRYARWVGSPHFWIDKDCVDQSNYEEKELAMDSMDLVYSGSQYPVGLMSTILRTENEIRTLQALLSSGGDCELTCGGLTIEQVMNLLELLYKDRWWQRAWIYQEEYLAGLRMDVLIRHDPDLEWVKKEVFSTESEDETGSEGREETSCESESGDQDDHIVEEICFRATELRQAATSFLLTLQGMSLERWQDATDRLLKRFGKYNMLYNLTKSANSKAMSARVIADIRARDIELEYDIIPIAANSCDYAARFDTRRMANSPYSADICTLAMFFMNGEIIANGKDIMPPPAKLNVGDYLDLISFDAFDPPVGHRELTWLKDCRFSEVELTPEGMCTPGHMWRVFDRFDVTRWNLDDPPAGDIDTFCLHELARKLRAAADNAKIAMSRLPDQLVGYLETFWLCKDSSAGRGHMRLMALEIARAIKHKEAAFLSLAELEWGEDDAYAIFVGDYDDGDLIFTSFSGGEVEDEDGRQRTRHVSLKVREETKGGSCLLRLTEWVNGLAFFEGREQRKKVFGWPTSWTKPTRKRKREDDVEDLEVIVID